MAFVPWHVSDQLKEWSRGQTHDVAPMYRTNINWHYQYLRRQAFFRACRNVDPALAVWPEFRKELHFTHLTRAWEKGTISTEVAGLLIAARNRSIGTWMARAARMERAGKNPLSRRRYRCAMRELYATIAEARRLIQVRHDEQQNFEQIARRLNGTA